MEQNKAPQTGVGTGYLVVQATTANGAIPLEGAAVTISARANGQDVLYELTTGRDGKTPRVSLPAPSRADSQRPGDQPVSSAYHIAVALAGYQKTEYSEVPIFDGIISIQQANLIPVPDNRYPDGFTRRRPDLFETPPSAL
ncbi:MAG: hypothetical protein IJC99_02610 [Clostridia bacterium]|nr:hypothetical protein [Clostridia bacterium]